uniref:Uncharacterized protein n=1 Tax=Micrurus lemniscatus lemniscatus TaxID=129467 RepID=A0A2D4HNV4_MICLE
MTSHFVCICHKFELVICETMWKKRFHTHGMVCFVQGLEAVVQLRSLLFSSQTFMASDEEHCRWNSTWWGIYYTILAIAIPMHFVFSYREMCNIKAKRNFRNLTTIFAYR